MRARRLAGCLVASVVLAGCGGAVEAQLETPSYLWNREASLCGNTMAIDGRAGWWAEGGCENGSTRLGFQGVLSETQRARIAAAFRAHPDPATFTETECVDYGERHRFRERARDGTTREWRMCIEHGTYLDLPPAPFDETVNAFKR